MARSKTAAQTCHLFVTGGVASSLGKGLTASSLGRLLKAVSYTHLTLPTIYSV